MLRKLLSTPTAQLGRMGRFAVFQIKLWSHCARLLKKNRAGQQAAALSYQTIFGIVPLAIVTLLIFQSLPAYSHYGEKIKTFVYDWANFSSFTSSASSARETEGTVALTQHLDAMVARFFTGANTGSITLFSVLLVIWAALALLLTIERSFNNIWHVGRGRSFLHRIINYWAVLTLGPLLVGVGIYISTRYLHISQIQKAVLSNTATILANAAPVVLSYAVATFIFFLLYFVLPNTKVQAKAAIWGALAAALVWTAAKNIYGYCVTGLNLYSTVYGVLALVPITVLWIYITWLIVLFGLQLTFTTQHLTSLDAAEIAAARKTEEYFIANDLTAINIVREIAAAFENNKAPVPPEIIWSKLNMPAEFGNKVLNHLVDRGLIAKTSDPRVGFIPAKDPAHIRLSDIAAAVAEVGFAQSTTEQSEGLLQIARSQRAVLQQYSLKQILGDMQAE
ncbi:MAG TPA: YhjD/YihY/BrkB family envelope integrity protein [Sedimentisphaerales bacterium]|nr:YhjD/YihY/BrkB family envelope integrity protein [Sedimentisphaerales bacterium]